MSHLGINLSDSLQTTAAVSHAYHVIPRKPLPKTKIRDNDQIADSDKFSHIEITDETITEKQPLFAIWWLELICCFSTICMIAAIIGTLQPYSGKTAPSLPYRISVNALLAVYATVMKTCNVVVIAESLSQLKWEFFKSPRHIQHLINYDRASRGIRGSFLLIFGFRGQYLLPVFGAILSIMTIAVDPFAQQMVSYYACNVILENGTTASTVRSSIYNDTGWLLGDYATSFSTAQRGAIVSGLFTPSANTVPVSCITGNCSFHDPYASVGFCSECSDVSDELEIFWSRSTFTWNQTLLNGTTLVNQTGEALYTRLPSGLATETKGKYTPEIFFVMNASDSQTSNYTTTYEMILGDMDYPNYNDLSSHTGTCVETWQKNTWGCRGYGAARCTIEPCVSIMVANVTNGVMNEHLLATYTNWSQGWVLEGTTLSSQLVMADLDCVNETGKAILERLGYDTRSSRFMPWHVALYGSSLNSFGYYEIGPTSDSSPKFTDSELTIVPAQCIYQIDQKIIHNMRTFSETYFTAQLIINFATAYLGPEQAFKLYNGSYVNAESISEAMSSVARALSIQARQWDTDGHSTFNRPALGDTWAHETCLRIRWLWIIYPALVSVSTIFFFAAVLMKTEIRDKDGLARGWKSSILPYIYHGIELTSSTTSAHKKRMSDVQFMDDAAKKDIAMVRSLPSNSSSVHSSPQSLSSEWTGSTCAHSLS